MIPACWSKMVKCDFEIIKPQWPNMPLIRAFTTLAQSKYGKVDFSAHSTAAIECMKSLEAYIKPKKPIHWINQIHGNNVIELPFSKEIEADGVVTSMPNIVCAMRSADCLPVVFASTKQDRVGVAHAGWRGLRSGIIYSTVELMSVDPARLKVWLGPAIGQNEYEVGAELYEEMTALNSKYKSAFKKGKKNKYYMSLYKIASIQLCDLGIQEAHISGGEWSTYLEDRFHSFRREGQSAGRMATVVWIQQQM